jgi:hypothetical protein
MDIDDIRWADVGVKKSAAERFTRDKAREKKFGRRLEISDTLVVSGCPEWG